MKLLLKEDVENVGSVGDEVEVKDGFGRNFLIPSGKAILATPRNLKAFNHQKSVVQAKYRKFKNAAEEVASKISAISCEFVKKVGDTGKLFGSVTSQDIADAVSKQGVDIDKRKIQLKEPIKALGDFTASYKVHPEVIAEIKIKVTKEESKTEDSGKTEEKPAEEK
jgi:large subunit ribosomal protein L9